MSPKESDTQPIPLPFCAHPRRPSALHRAGLSERGALARFGCHGERGARDYKGVCGGARSGVPRAQPPVEGQGGFAEPGLGMGEVGFCWTNQSYKRSSGVIMDL